MSFTKNDVLQLLNLLDPNKKDWVSPAYSAPYHADGFFPSAFNVTIADCIAKMRMQLKPCRTKTNFMNVLQNNLFRGYATTLIMCYETGDNSIPQFEPYLGLLRDILGLPRDESDGLIINYTTPNFARNVANLICFNVYRNLLANYIKPARSQQPFTNSKTIRDSAYYHEPKVVLDSFLKDRLMAENYFRDKSPLEDLEDEDLDGYLHIPKDSLFTNMPLLEENAYKAYLDLVNKINAHDVENGSNYSFDFFDYMYRSKIAMRWINTLMEDTYGLMFDDKLYARMVQQIVTNKNKFWDYGLLSKYEISARSTDPAFKVFSIRKGFLEKWQERTDNFFDDLLPKQQDISTRTIGPEYYESINIFYDYNYISKIQNLESVRLFQEQITVHTGFRPFSALISVLKQPCCAILDKFFVTLEKTDFSQQLLEEEPQSPFNKTYDEIINAAGYVVHSLAVYDENQELRVAAETFIKEWVEITLESYPEEDLVGLNICLEDFLELMNETYNSNYISALQRNRFRANKSEGPKPK